MVSLFRSGLREFRPMFVYTVDHGLKAANSCKSSHHQKDKTVNVIIITIFTISVGIYFSANIYIYNYIHIYSYIHTYIYIYIYLGDPVIITDGSHYDPSPFCPHNGVEVRTVDHPKPGRLDSG